MTKTKLINVKEDNFRIQYLTNTDSKITLHTAEFLKIQKIK